MKLLSTIALTIFTSALSFGQTLQDAIHKTDNERYTDAFNEFNSLVAKEPNNGETDEGMGAASAGGYSTQLFSATKKDIEDITKVEATEATGSVSSGSYLTTAAWAKSTKKKDWRGKSKTQIPGGKFVQVKKKCKKFPYCNQGDINALKLTNEGIVDNVIKKLSEKYNLSESVIRTILKNHLNQNK